MPDASDTKRPAQAPEQPVDKMIAFLRGAIEGLETEQAKARELPEIPDDIPRFVTRNW